MDSVDVGGTQKKKKKLNQIQKAELKKQQQLAQTETYVHAFSVFSPSLVVVSSVICATHTMTMRPPARVRTMCRCRRLQKSRGVLLTVGVLFGVTLVFWMFSLGTQSAAVIFDVLDGQRSLSLFFVL